MKNEEKGKSLTFERYPTSKYEVLKRERGLKSKGSVMHSLYEKGVKFLNNKRVISFLGLKFL